MTGGGSSWKVWTGRICLLQKGNFWGKCRPPINQKMIPELTWTARYNLNRLTRQESTGSFLFNGEKYLLRTSEIFHSVCNFFHRHLIENTTPNCNINMCKITIPKDCLESIFGILVILRRMHVGNIFSAVGWIFSALHVPTWCRSQWLRLQRMMRTEKQRKWSEAYFLTNA